MWEADAGVVGVKILTLTEGCVLDDCCLHLYLLHDCYSLLCAAGSSHVVEVAAFEDDCDAHDQEICEVKHELYIESFD